MLIVPPFNPFPLHTFCTKLVQLHQQPRGARSNNCLIINPGAVRLIIKRGEERRAGGGKIWSTSISIWLSRNPRNDFHYLYPLFGGGNRISSNNVADPRRDKWVNGRGEGRKARAERGTRRTGRVLAPRVGKAGR